MTTLIALHRMVCIRNVNYSLACGMWGLFCCQHIKTIRKIFRKMFLIIHTVHVFTAKYLLLMLLPSTCYLTVYLREKVH